MLRTVFVRSMQSILTVQDGELYFGDRRNPARVKAHSCHILGLLDSLSDGELPARLE